MGRIWDRLMMEVSVKRKGSSLREGHGVERRYSEQVSLSFWSEGKGVEERESSRVSAIWRTIGSERTAIGVTEGLGETLSLEFFLGFVDLGLVGGRKFEK